MWAKHSTSNPVYTDGATVRPKTAHSQSQHSQTPRPQTPHPKTKHLQIAHPVIIPIPGYGFTRGDVSYTEEDFQEIFSYGIKTLAIRKKRRERRADARRILDKFKEDIKKEMEGDDLDINVLMQDEPFDGLGFQFDPSKCKTLKLGNRRFTSLVYFAPS